MKNGTSRRRSECISRTNNVGMIDDTLAAWQPRSQKELTREDAREIVANVTGFFRVLEEWNQADLARKNRVKY